MAAISCPDARSLQNFVLGQLPEDQAESFVQHFAQCQHCVQTLSNLKVSDTLLDALRAASAATLEKPVSQDVATLIERFRQLPAKTASTEASTQGDPSYPESESISGAATVAPASQSDDSIETHDFLAPAQSPDELGRLGGYRVLRVLGTGGMGTVFLAEDPRLQRQVALKTMKPTLAASKSARDRFQREARATAAVKHDHIVTIHEVNEDRGVPFLAMELLEGESLDDRLRRSERLPLAESLRIGGEIAIGLAAAHKRGLLHRDIKPANIWLEAVGSGQWLVASEKKDATDSLATDHWPLTTTRVKIVDFGLARTADDSGRLTQQGAIVGTPAYMAPEQATGSAVDARCDLFSLGCVLYRMTTGKAAFRGVDSISTLVAVATDNPTPPCQLNSAIPRALSDLTMKLLAKKPEERCQSALEVADALARIERNASSDAETVRLRDDASPSEPRPSAIASTRPAGNSANKRKWLVVATALLVLGGLGAYVATIVIRVPGEHGELVVEVDDENLEAVVGQKVVKFRDLKTMKQVFELAPGGGVVIFRDATTGNELFTEKFELKKNGKAQVRARMEKIAAAREMMNDPDRRAAEWVLSIGGKLLIEDIGPIVRPDQIPQKPRLRRIEIIGGDQKTVAAAVKVLRDVSSLYSLTLTNIPITDGEIGQLARHSWTKNLNTLEINNAPDITDVGLEHICKGLSSLQHLRVAGVKITNDGLDHLKHLQSLEGLGLTATAVTDQGLVHVTKLKHLEVLGLGGTKVTNKGLPLLRDLASLQVLHLSLSNVGDAGLEHLQSLPRLTHLYLDRTGVTVPGIKKLVAALP